MITADDDAILRVLAGASFPPGARVTLPSGIVLDADEATALTTAYLPADGLPDRTPPAHLAPLGYTVPLRQAARQLTAVDHLRVQLKDARVYGRQMWIVALYFAGVASLAVVLLLGALFTG